MISIRGHCHVEALAGRIEFVPHPYETVPAGSTEDLELRMGERVDVEEHNVLVTSAPVRGLQKSEDVRWAFGAYSACKAAISCRLKESKSL
jgi:hypothetical protein